jgi:dynein heavy chain
VILTNVINTSFEGASRIDNCMALLEAFYTMAKRNAIHRCVEKKTADVFSMFVDECNNIRADFDKWRMEPPLHHSEPQFAGAALWARGMQKMINRNWTLLENAKGYLTHCREKDDAEVAYHSTSDALQDYQTQRYQVWLNDLNALNDEPSGNLNSRLENPLMRRGTVEQDANQPVKKGKKGELMSNFDIPLLGMFNEVAYWERMGGDFPIPYIALDICNQKEKLRILREHVMLVVRDYNQILDELSTDERRLFSDHIRRLDKRINQGVNKLTWASKGIQEWYVRDCRKACEDTYTVVLQFKAGKEMIARMCRLIGNTLLIKIEKNYVYDEGVFEAKQQEYHTAVKKTLTQAHQQIKNAMVGMYEHFRDNPGEVQREWRAFVGHTDKQVEAVLRQTVKRSLQELSRAINGDNKTEPQPLFRIRAVLENNRVEYQPNMISLTQAVNIVSKEVIAIITVMPRLKEVLLRHDDHHHGGELQSFYDLISNDDDTLKILVQIMNGMSSSATELQKYLSYWDKYKPIWEMDKDAFIRRYAKAERPLLQYDVDITRYREQQSDIQGEDLSNTINFIQIDCTMLKVSLVTHCVQWQAKLTGLLNQNALKELEFLHEMFKSTSAKLTVAPTDLNHLNASLNLLHENQKELESIETRFEPIENMYQVLQKFDVQTTDTEHSMLATLRPTFDEYTEMLGTSEKMLARSKINMKKNLESALDSFNNNVVQLRENAMKAMPYAADVGVDKALQILDDYKQKVANARQQETDLKPGLEIFNMKAPDPKEVRDTEKDLDLLSKIWGEQLAWNQAWEEWKFGKFSSLNIEDMELSAAQFNKRVAKLGREIKSWTVWQEMKQQIDQFRSTMPLIMDLKNPTIRTRHWKALQDEIGKKFDPTGDEFTLEKVFTLGLHNYGEFIGEMSANANKEYAIETALEEVAERWATIDVDIVEYKGEYFKVLCCTIHYTPCTILTIMHYTHYHTLYTIHYTHYHALYSLSYTILTMYFQVRSTEDLFQVLEDDSVALSTMKSSKFYHAFKPRIDTWEHNLSHTSEVLECILTVQRQWMYLESIFMASEDIQKQLPSETALFMDVNKSWKENMAIIFAIKNALKACITEGLLEKAQQMDSDLEKIQKSLDQVQYCAALYTIHYTHYHTLYSLCPRSTSTWRRSGCCSLASTSSVTTTFSRSSASRRTPLRCRSTSRSASRVSAL